MTCLVVAEISANHQGDLGQAIALVEAAARAGAHAVKIQTWHPDLMVLERDYVVEEGPWAGRNLRELYHEAHTPWAWHGEIFKACERFGVIGFTSVFDIESLAFLEAEHQVPMYKVASFELGDHLLIRALARTRKPLILSTGMATRVEVEDAVLAAKHAGCVDLTLLRCTSAYPAGPAQANLRTMRHMAEVFGCKAGLSDHTQGIGVAIAAAGMGARVIEKHLCLPTAPGAKEPLDAAFSITPDKLHELVLGVADASIAAGEITYGPTVGERPQLALRRSLYLARDVAPGDVLTMDSVRSARPARGLPPRMLGRFLGKTAITNERAGAPLTWGLIEPADAIAEA